MTVARDYDDVEWRQVTDGLAERGLLTRDGELTAEGRALKDDVEERTDRIALGAFATLADDELEQFLAALTPLARAVVATGDLPNVMPMGLNLDEKL
jgi:Helix-turn-helix family